MAMEGPVTDHVTRIGDIAKMTSSGIDGTSAGVCVQRHVG